MRMTLVRSRLALPAVAVATLLAAGCGGGAPKPKATDAKTETSIYISAKDCDENSKLGMTRCAELVDGAIAEHLKTAPTYLSLRTCEEKEGADRCERSDERAFRPRLIAFAVSLTGDKSTAIPVYILNTSKQTGFRNGKQNYLLTDDTLVVSKKSAAVYDSLRGKPTGGGGSPFGGG